MRLLDRGVARSKAKLVAGDKVEKTTSDRSRFRRNFSKTLNRMGRRLKGR
jgi:hypothetical protein